MTSRSLAPKSICRVGCFGLTRLIWSDSDVLRCEQSCSRLCRCVQKWTEIGSHLGECIQKWMELGAVASHLPEEFSQSRNSGFADQTGNSRFASHSARDVLTFQGTAFLRNPPWKAWAAIRNRALRGVGTSGPDAGKSLGGLVLQNDTPAKTWLSSMPFIHLKSEYRTSRQTHPIHPQCEDEA